MGNDPFLNLRIVAKVYDVYVWLYITVLFLIDYYFKVKQVSIDLSDIFILLILIFIFCLFKEHLKESKLEVSWLKKIDKVGAFFSLNDSGLSKQPIFWIGVITPLILSSYMEYLILTTTDVSLTIQNLGKLFDLSKVPLYITALTPTFGIFIANIHRSIQTKKQIDTSLTQINISNNQYATALDQFRIAEKKNLSDGFYAHYKYISDEFKNIVLREKKDSAFKSLSEKKLLLLDHMHFIKGFFQTLI